MKRLLPLLMAVLLLTGCQKSDPAVLRSGEFGLSPTEFSYYYWSEFFYLKEAYGEYLEGVVDLSKPLDDQWQDYLIDEALNVAADTLTMVFAAESAGFLLPDEYIEALDATWDGFAAAADGDIAGYLQASYGENATEETFRAYLEHAHISAAYAEHLYESLDPEPEEIDKYLQDHMGEYLDEGLTEEDELCERAKQDLLSELHGEQVRQLRAKYDFRTNRENVILVPPEGLYN